MSEEEFEVMDTQLISVIANLLGFKNQGDGLPPVASGSARSADFLLMNWVVSNATDEPIKWNFFAPKYFELYLVWHTESDSKVIWTLPDNPEGITPDDSPVLPWEVTVPINETFSIPPESDDNPLKIRQPLIPLNEIITDNVIPWEDNLSVHFRFLAEEFPSETMIPLWR